jgi:hypothetical protein
MESQPVTGKRELQKDRESLYKLTAELTSTKHKAGT